MSVIQNLRKSIETAAPDGISQSEATALRQEMLEALGLKSWQGGVTAKTLNHYLGTSWFTRGLAPDQVGVLKQLANEAAKSASTIRAAEAYAVKLGLKPTDTIQWLYREINTRMTGEGATVAQVNARFNNIVYQLAPKLVGKDTGLPGPVQRDPFAGLAQAYWFTHPNEMRRTSNPDVERAMADVVRIALLHDVPVVEVAIVRGKGNTQGTPGALSSDAAEQVVSSLVGLAKAGKVSFAQARQAYEAQLQAGAKTTQHALEAARLQLTKKPGTP